MHGVSDAAMSRAFDSFGFPKYIPVVAQQKPDPDFPTVKFPNPEEKGMSTYLTLQSRTLHIHPFDRSVGTSVVIRSSPKLTCGQDLAIATADESGADYILAQDPDSDRFAAAEKG